MNIALLGYGKMGKAIERIALERQHNISLIIDIHNSSSFTANMLKNSDVAIEFSRAESVVGNLEKCLDANIPVICGTTGWLEHLPRIKEKTNQTDGTFLYASNFSIGVNLFFKLNTLLSKMMAKHNSYNVSIVETHHIHKLDAPSGTAITLAEQIIENTELEKWSLGGKTDNKSIPIEALREGEVPGTHTVMYDCPIDSISITHAAKNRDGFALGAVLAAEFLKGKKGIFTMDDVLEL